MRYYIAGTLLLLSIIVAFPSMRKHLVWYDLPPVSINKSTMILHDNMVMLMEPLPGKAGREISIIGEKYRKEEANSRLTLHENGIELSRLDKLDNTEALNVRGAYYHGKDALYIFSSDGTSPKFNNSTYTVTWPRTIRLYWTTLPLALFALLLLIPEFITLVRNRLPIALSIYSCFCSIMRHITKKRLTALAKLLGIYGVITFASVALFLTIDYLISVTNSFQQVQIDLLGQTDVLRISHPVYHHDLRPNVNVICEWGSYSYRMITDQYGFKNSAQVCDVSNKHFNILFIGDSFTEGVGLPYEETFVGMFAAQHPELRIANAAVASYSPSIYFKKVEYLLKEGFTFDHVIIFIDIGDIQDEAIYLFDINNNLTPETDHGISSSFRFSRKIYRELSMRLFDPVPPQPTPSWLLEPNPVIWTIRRGNWTYTPESDAYGSIGLNGAIGKATESMHRLKALLDKHGATMTLGVYPWPSQLKNDVKNHRGSTLWREFSVRENCVAFIDANPPFFDELKDKGFDNVMQTYYFKNDVHFTKAGNILLFKELENQWRSTINRE